MALAGHFWAQRHPAERLHTTFVLTRKMRATFSTIYDTYSEVDSEVHPLRVAPLYLGGLRRRRGVRRASCGVQSGGAMARLGYDRR